MTPNMIRALQDAAPHGLRRFGGDWVARDPLGKPRADAARHHKGTITALQDRGLLQLYAANAMARLTESGETRRREMAQEAGQ